MTENTNFMGEFSKANTCLGGRNTKKIPEIP